MNPAHYRPAPGPSGLQRSSDYPKVKWLDEHGVIHQAAGRSNHCLCELLEHWLSIVIVQALPWEEPVTCVRCIPQQWRFEDDDEDPT